MLKNKDNFALWDLAISILHKVVDYEFLQVLYHYEVSDLPVLKTQHNLLNLTFRLFNPLLDHKFRPVHQELLLYNEVFLIKRLDREEEIELAHELGVYGGLEVLKSEGHDLL